MPDSPRRRRVAILVNVIAPYRLPVYEGIADTFDTSVFTSGREANRSEWGDTRAAARKVAVRRSRGVTVPYRTGGRRVYDQRYLHLPLGQLADLRRAAPDAIVTTEMGPRTILALAYGAVTRTPVWVWWGGTTHTERGVGRGRALARRLIARWAHRWISYGASSTAYLRTLGISRNRILEIQNCVDESLYLNAPPLVRRSAREPVLLYVGQMIRRKGVDSLLRAAATLHREGRSFSLHLVGDGPERAAFEAMARDLGLARRVRFLGSRRPEEMPVIYRTADLLVFPTHADPWGLVVNEALWSGLPVICSIHAGCAAELVPTEQTFDPFDADDFARALRAGLDGEVGPPDTRRMRRCEEVSGMITADLERALERVPS